MAYRKRPVLLTVEIPVNTTSEIWIPSTGVITESGRPVVQVQEIEKVKTEGKYTVLAVGSGKYNFATDY